jgi:predicted dehydrogenase
MSVPSSDRVVSRRDLLRAGVVAGAAMAMPAVIPARAFGAADRVRLGFVGVKNQGTNNLKAFLGKSKRVDVVALADVDRDVLAKAVALAGKSSGKEPAGLGDYRRLLDREDIDAVVITTPDHWHARMTVDACEAGKDVYCEKPLTLFVDEGKAVVAAARRTGRVVQTGSQQRSDARFRQACELIRNGALGTIKTVRVGLPAVNFDGPPVPDSAPPPELDYETWLGPAPQRPYNLKRVHYLFRFFWDYSGGQMTNFGAHHLDIAQWALGRDESGPVKVAGKATFHPEKWYEVPMKSELTYTYDDGVTVLCEQGPGTRSGCFFEGSRGTLYVTRGKIESTPADILKASLPAGATRLEVSNDHHANWLDCIASRAKPIADVAIGHRSATVCHLGNIALRLGRPIRWDPTRETIPDDSEAAAMLTRPYRAPWVRPTV